VSAHSPLCRTCGDAADGCGSCFRWKRAISAAVEDEREACAKVAEEKANDCSADGEYFDRDGDPAAGEAMREWAATAREIARAIRARGDALARLAAVRGR
jgi:hypothetical protein